MTQYTLDGKTLTLANYLGTKAFSDVYFDTVNMCALIDSGLACFLVAPPSGGKTTIIKTVEGMYQNKRFTYALERISPMRFLKLQYQMQDRDNLLLSEDFSTLGDEESAVFKMATLIAKLSYDKKYIDPFFTTKDAPEGLKLIVKSLAFICGMQPQWIQIYGGKEVFETLIMEKILRYYRLPIAPIKDIAPMAIVMRNTQDQILQQIDMLNAQEKERTPEELEKHIRYFTDALKVQCGARGIEYARIFVPHLAKYIPKAVFNEWLIQTAQRFRFEEHFLLRGYVPLKIGVKHEALYREYMVLFFALQYNLCTYDMMRYFCKIRGKNKSATARYMRLLIRYALESGFVNVIKRKKVCIIPSDAYQKFSINDYHAKLFKTKAEDKEKGEDNA